MDNIVLLSSISTSKTFTDVIIITTAYCLVSCLIKKL